MVTQIGLLLVGFFVLIKGANWLVEGASALAKKLGISPLVIGLTIVAFGTSAPELIVNLFSSLSGANDIAIGNIVGSNIVNILLILGLSAVIFPLKVTKGTVWKEIPFALLGMLVILVKANDNFFDPNLLPIISRADGLIMLAFFVIFLYYTFGISLSQNSDSEAETIKPHSQLVSVVYIFTGLVSLVIGGKLIVDNAVFIAESLKISQAFIGLTIVAIGTSLPEMATSLVAASKKHADIAVGNIIGSNIFNVFFILGSSSLISPVKFESQMNFDVWVATIATLLVFLAMFIGKKRVLERWQGILFVMSYIGYIAYLVYRG